MSETQNADENAAGNDAEKFAEDDIFAALTISVRRTSTGTMISMESTGEFSGITMDNRFFFIDGMPPDDCIPPGFWGPILYKISSHLYAEFE